MSLIESLKEEAAYLREGNMIKTEIIKSFTEKNQLAAVWFLQNEHPNSEFNISFANNKKTSKIKISTENEHHRDHSLPLAKENNKDTQRKKMRRKRNQNWRTVGVKNTIVLGDSIIGGWRSNWKMKFIV